MNIITSSVNTLPKNVRIASDFHFNLATHLEGFWAASSDIRERTTIILLIPLNASHCVGGDDFSFIVAWHYQDIKRTQRHRSYQSRSKQAISISSAKIMLHFYK